MRALPAPLIVVSPGLPTVSAMNDRRRIPMSTRIALLAVLAAAIALAASALAIGGGGGLIFDDGHYVKPGSLDDGKQYLPLTRISLGQAVAAAQRAASGQLGQVDLGRVGSLATMLEAAEENEVVDQSGDAIRLADEHVEVLTGGGREVMLP